MTVPGVQRASTFPSRQYSSAAAQTTTNSPAMANPAALMLKLAAVSQNAPCRLISVLSTPRISIVPTMNAAPMDSPVMTRL